jgi:hypothetical protein
VTTADWALVISIVSALVSAAGFVWNVWSKFIYPKPRVRVSFNMMQIVAKDPLHGLDVLTLNATNMGPGEVTLYAAMLYKRPWFSRKVSLALLQPLHNFPAQREYTLGPFGGGLPKKLAVAEEFTVYLTADHEAIAEEKFDKIGFSDTFGRYHFARTPNFREVREKIRELRAKKQFAS